ncbi:MAG TPA: MBL fold metallo-hydrolase [Thermoanaerobaculia bacterium]|nr:MBL fold metallo-hydrolase [Thermoanaerobaculia bacterium]
MAKRAERLPGNASGEFFVDATCIDCATCREMLPSVYAAGDGFSVVHRQPMTPEETHRALMALVACPTGSIGTVSRRSAAAAAAAFPEPLGDDVFFCGFTSERSFGAWSYLVRRPEGNLLVDSPRAAAPLLKRLGEMGGVSKMLLTHRDDVADHEQIRATTRCERVIHRRDAAALGGAAERVLDGEEALEIVPGLLAIPTPGHTPGHVVYLWRETVLFSGDHLAFSARRGHLVAFRDACWYSWEEQIRSMERLLTVDFTTVLPGHGERFRAPSPAAMKDELRRCVAWMKTRR